AADRGTFRSVVLDRGTTRHQPGSPTDPALAQSSTRGLAADIDRSSGEQPAAQWAPLAPFAVMVRRPLRLHHVPQDQAGSDDLPDAVTHGAVLLDVHGLAVL